MAMDEAMDLETAILESAKDLGYPYLKEKQKEAVKSLMKGNDVFVALPTGYGKSVIFAVLPSAFDRYKGKHIRFKARVTVPMYNIGTCGSISPLTSLMMDQHAKFKPKGIRTEFVCEAQSNEISTDRVIKGEIQLVYISPESAICNYKYRNMFLSSPYKDHLVAIAVD